MVQALLTLELHTQVVAVEAGGLLAVQAVVLAQVPLVLVEVHQPTVQMQLLILVLAVVREAFTLSHFQTSIVQAVMVVLEKLSFVIRKRRLTNGSLGRD